MSDSIHPNDAGYQIMAERVEPVLRDLVESD
jgi:lysophospholipase L1-like esterase